MSYGNDKYNVCMFYSLKSDEAFNALDNFMAWLIVNICDITLLQKGLINMGGTKITSDRQKKYKNSKTLIYIIGKVIEAEEAGIYIR